MDTTELAEVLELMRRHGALYVKLGELEVYLGSAALSHYEQDQQAAQFVDDRPKGERSRRNPLLDHPALRKG